jgi:hypothetical protein
MRSLWIAFAAVVLALPLVTVAAPKAHSGSESLGNQLLDDLAPTSKPIADPPAPPEQPNNAPLAPNNTPLARVQAGMQNAQALLAQPGAAALPSTVKVAGNVQQEVVTELDKLIAELSKQCNCQGGQCNKPGEPKPGSQPKPGSKPAMAAGTAKSAARDSTDRLDRTTAKPVDKGEVEDVVKALWGHLPERAREQVLQSFSDDFLPKYQLEIEKYYLKLGEEQGGRAN